MKALALEAASSLARRTRDGLAVAGLYLLVVLERTALIPASCQSAPPLSFCGIGTSRMLFLEAVAYGVLVSVGFAGLRYNYRRIRRCSCGLEGVEAVEGE